MNLLNAFKHPLALLGLLLGAVISELLLRVRSNEGLHALLLCSGGAMVFALTNLVGGSGFLAIYLTGLVAGNRRGGTGDNVLKAMDSMAWLAQSGMFLILGLLVTPSRLTENLPWALAVAAFLMLLARPIAVWVSLLPFRFTLREETFIAHGRGLSVRERQQHRYGGRAGGQIH